VFFLQGSMAGSARKEEGEGTKNKEKKKARR
jgi:hypothetical protein